MEEKDATPDEVFDPYDTEAMREMPPTESSTEEVMLGITPRKPKKSEFFRSWNDPAYIIDAYVLEHEGSNGRKEDFLVPARADLRAACEQTAGSSLKAVRFFACMNRYSSMFIWPARIPSDRANEWAKSALAAADASMTHWVRVQSDMSASRYTMSKAVVDMGEPDWPDATMRDLLALAFDEEHTILSVDHPVLLELRGEL